MPPLHIPVQHDDEKKEEEENALARESSDNSNHRSARNYAVNGKSMSIVTGIPEKELTARGTAAACLRARSLYNWVALLLYYFPPGARPPN